MKLPLKHRCPWCGEIVKTIRSQKNSIKKCGNCGHKYTYYNDGAASKIFVLFGMLWIIIAALSMLHISIFIVYCVFYLFIYLLFEKIVSYERFDDDNIRFSIKKYSAKITFEQSDKFLMEYIKTRIFLSDKAIIPICFVSKNDKPLSHAICISMENTRRITNNEYECVFSFLPHSSVSYDASKTCDFYLFDGDRKRVAKGRIMAEYNGFV